MGIFVCFSYLFLQTIEQHDARGRLLAYRGRGVGMCTKDLMAGKKAEIPLYYLPDLLHN